MVKKSIETLAKPTLAKPTLAKVKVLVVRKIFGFWELIVWLFLKLIVWDFLCVLSCRVWVERVGSHGPKKWGFEGSGFEGWGPNPDKVGGPKGGSPKFHVFFFFL